MKEKFQRILKLYEHSVLCSRASLV